MTNRPIDPYAILSHQHRTPVVERITLTSFLKNTTPNEDGLLTTSVGASRSAVSPGSEVPSIGSSPTSSFLAALVGVFFTAVNSNLLVLGAEEEEIFGRVVRVVDSSEGVHWKMRIGGLGDREERRLG